MIKTISYLFISVLILSVYSCGLYQTSSKVVTKNIQLGMTKENVVNLIGSPYKKALQHGENNKTIEILYYKETIWAGDTQRLIESILTFEDGVLSSINQGKERNPNSPSVNITNSN